MSVLSGPEIVRILNRTRGFRSTGQEPPLPQLDIDPFNPEFVGPNSVDVTLSDKLLVYGRWGENEGGDPEPAAHIWLDSRDDNPTTELTIPSEGIVLFPGNLYLGSTVEKTSCAGLVPWLDGRSSQGRLGIQVHMTAGRGDDGWGVPIGCSWTLEITVVYPTIVYPFVRIGQLTFFTLTGDRKPYSGKYKNQSGPTASRLHLDKENPANG